MRQLHDEDLILYFYGETEDPEEIRTLLAGSPELSARYDALRRTLETAGEAFPVPERPESYGAEVWEKLQPYLTAGVGGGSSPLGGGGLEQGGGQEGGGSNHPKTVRGHWGHPLLASPIPNHPLPGGGTHRPDRPWKSRLAGWLAAAVLLLAVGFLAGRFLPRPDGEPRVAEALSSEARERILTRTMAAHLERSERLLTELANAETGGAVDISAERRWAQDLLSANRLYRQITRRGGRPMLSSLLDDLEPFLLELAHSPSEIPAADLADLRARLAEQALLFKMRVVSRRLERKPTL